MGTWCLKGSVGNVENHYAQLEVESKPYICNITIALMVKFGVSPSWEWDKEVKCLLQAHTLSKMG